ncbi:MAG: 50S ribosomal protein L17 [Phycisphaerae bacterium]
MRHRIVTMKLARTTAHRRAMMRNLAAALFISGRIKTTIQKARFVRSFVEKIITLAKVGNLAARRQVIAELQDRYIVDKDETDVKRDKSLNIVKAPKLIKKIFDQIAPKYAGVSGGYTRIIRLSERRIGDNGELVFLELTDPTQDKNTKKSKTGGNRKLKAQSRIALMNKLLKVEKKSQAPKQESQESPKPE